VPSVNPVGTYVGPGQETPPFPFQGQVRVGGRGARCEVGSPLTTLFVKDASFDDNGDKEDTSNTESQGYGSGTIGMETCRYDIKGDWDSALNRFQQPFPGIFPRDDLPQNYYINVTDNLSWQFPYSLVTSAKVAIPTRTLVSMDWSGESNSVFNRPSPGQ
jgi:hypothetical protein